MATGALVVAGDLVIGDPLVDAGADAPMLIDAFFRERRRVFIDLAKLPAAVFERMRVRREVSVAIVEASPQGVNTPRPIKVLILGQSLRRSMARR